MAMNEESCRVSGALKFVTRKDREDFAVADTVLPPAGQDTRTRRLCLALVIDSVFSFSSFFLSLFDFVLAASTYCGKFLSLSTRSREGLPFDIQDQNKKFTPFFLSFFLSVQVVLALPFAVSLLYSSSFFPFLFIALLCCDPKQTPTPDLLYTEQKEDINIKT